MADGGAWRRPRMKVYDYNQELGGNYYQVRTTWKQSSSIFSYWIHGYFVSIYKYQLTSAILWGHPNIQHRQPTETLIPDLLQGIFHHLLQQIKAEPHCQHIHNPQL